MRINFYLFFVIAFVSLQSNCYASVSPDTSGILLASNKTEYCVETIKSNVVFPELLKAHEEASLHYIEQFSVSRRAYIIRMYQKSKKYFTRIQTIFKKYGVPEEYCVLIALESAFNPNAISSAGAVGYWQFMENVAKEYGLKTLSLNELKKPAVKSVKGKHVPTDDRKNFIKSTYAAAKYLRDRSINLTNDPLLIAASYNWGVGNVWNRLERTGKKDAGFWDIKNQLPAETRTYVMNFIALNVLFLNYEKFYKKELHFYDKTIQIPIDAISGSTQTSSSL
ncbi:MAG: lytic transglycosylase domain-containing protein [Ferruginibacter sp.]|nr:lytic transglycosylase domain-containing protein [Ferruginibacter sp.]